jgi:OOP family OmpA-OmpF porin
MMFFVMTSTLLIGCAAQKPLTMFTPTDMNPKVQAGEYVPKVDNFMIIFDASATMAEAYKDSDKFNLAREIVSRMNQTIPDMELMGGLRKFGESFCPFNRTSSLIYGLTPYSEQGLEDALDTMKKAYGGSPLAAAIEAAGKDLAPASGPSALIVVSDGKWIDNTPVVSAEEIKNQFGDRICIYTVLVGDDPKGQSLMKKVADAGGCGFSVTADQIYSSDDMADFVQKVFFKKVVAKALDSDGDGVIDELDRCPGTPGGVAVDKRGCPLDTDGDGVYDYKDQCPGTPKGAKVDAVGCWVLGLVYFDSDKSKVKSEFNQMLDEVEAVMKQNPDLKVEVRGHTDNRFSKEYNQKLSEDRAESVVAYLVKKGIDRGRFVTVGYGLSTPAASNSTREGRAKNRRVELAPVR